MPIDNNITNSQEQNATTNQQAESQKQGDNTVKNPDEWTTGNEPMTGAQKSYLKTLSDEVGEELDASLTKAQASKRIEELQHRTGRGLNKKNDVPNQANTGEPE